MSINRFPLNLLAPTNAANNAGLVFDTPSGLWTPKTIVRSVVQGSNITVDITDPANPIVSAAAGALTIQGQNTNVATAVTQIDFQGNAVSVANGTGEVVVTISALPLATFTAKGDLIAGTANAAADRVAVGSDGQTLVAWANASTGVKWLANSVPVVLLAAGSNSANVPANTPVGSIILIKA